MNLLRLCSDNALHLQKRKNPVQIISGQDPFTRQMDVADLICKCGRTEVNSAGIHQLYTKSGVPKSTIGNVINCSYDSVKLRIIHEMCQGLEIDIPEFFNSPLFAETNLDP